eukprot:TRINITY_DN9464_c0_g1_i2.p1 TRINITY_DN9464_c0_g1~~TRINITY_DN9464_c0_g1_i2.p1  ORF type:complete len:149 (+),score=18.64 TRINITY_DN9464_c0_g1_i2:150-596(+)
MPGGAYAVATSGPQLAFLIGEGVILSLAFVCLHLHSCEVHDDAVLIRSSFPIPFRFGLDRISGARVVKQLFPPDRSLLFKFKLASSFERVVALDLPTSCCNIGVVFSPENPAEFAAAVNAAIAAYSGPRTSGCMCCSVSSGVEPAEDV